MTFDLVMPQLGMTMTEGTVVRWIKAVGEPVAKSEPVLEIQTDKVDMEVESPFDGFLVEVAVAEGVTVPVGHLVGRIGTDPHAVATPDPRELPESVTPPEHTRTLVSPRARRVAAEHGVDLKQVTGSGALGRIREADVLDYLAAHPAPKPLRGQPINALHMGAHRVIAERLTASVATVPQFWLAREVDASAIVALRKSVLQDLESRIGVRLSYTDMLIKALAYCLERMPEMKQRWVADRLEPVEGCGIGFAAQAPDRLMVPVIAGAAERSLSAIAVERARLAECTRQGQLKPGDLDGACCTLSNLGALGVDEFRAIINPPESCILAAGRIAPRPFVIDGELTVRPTLRLVLTVDHRVANGVAGARFLSSLADALQNPVSMLA